MQDKINSSKKHPLFVPVQHELQHPDAQIEWWFLHGNFRSEKNISGHFMLSIFHHAIAEEKDHQHGCSLLFRLQDSSTQIPFIVSKADARIKDVLRHSKNEFLKTNINPYLAKTYFDEVEKYGVPTSMSYADQTASFDDNGFGIKWDDFSLYEQKGSLMLEFKVPGTDETITFKMCSQTQPISLDMLQSPGNRKMAYITYPQLELQGHYMGSAVTGRAWFDHQWGDMSWFLSAEPEGIQQRLLGWDWFGINLNDGRAMVILVHRDMETKAVIASNLIIITPDGSAEKIEDFSIEPLRSWYSCRTCISYPVEWKIKIPSLKSELIFMPSSDDQEIPVAGVTRAIWEGAGSITGTLFAKSITGTARLELNGYGYVFNLSEIMDRFSERIYRHIQVFFPEVPDEEFFFKYTGIKPENGNVEAVREILTKPIWDLLKRGGKYWRPMFGLLMTEILGLDSRKYEDMLSVTTELTHLASLIIDDIEDGALVRRQEKCIHLKYGTDVAINAANTLYFMPILKLKENEYLTDRQALEIYGKSMDFFVKAHIGQGLDIFRSSLPLWPQDMDYSSLIKDSLNIYALKSAASVEFVTHTACIIANADKVITDALVKYARSFGISFQIKDDIHDFADAEKWTKDPGIDLTSGKLTYVILLALERLKGEELTFIKNILSKINEPSPENIKRGIEIIRSSGALESANAKVFSILNESWQELSCVIPQSDAKIMMKVICEHLLNLEFASFDITA